MIKILPYFNQDVHILCYYREDDNNEDDPASSVEWDLGTVRVRDQRKVPNGEPQPYEVNYYILNIAPRKECQNFKIILELEFVLQLFVVLI